MLYSGVHLLTGAYCQACTGCMIGYGDMKSTRPMMISTLIAQNHFNTFRPRRDGHHFPDDIFKCILLNENAWILIKILLKFHKGPINNIPALVQIKAWRRSGDKPLSEPMMVSLRIYSSFGVNLLTVIRIDTVVKSLSLFERIYYIPTTIMLPCINSASLHMHAACKLYSIDAFLKINKCVLASITRAYIYDAVHRRKVCSLQNLDSFIT